LNHNATHTNQQTKISLLTQTQKWNSESSHISLSLFRSAWLKKPPSQYDVSMIDWFITSRRDSYQHTNKRNKSLSSLTLFSFSLSSFFVFSLLHNFPIFSVFFSPFTLQILIFVTSNARSSLTIWIFKILLLWFISKYDSSNGN
jgi:membrane-associated HD superfamily phosphohydrolase